MKIKHSLPPEDDFSYWNNIEHKWRNTLPRMNEKELYEEFLSNSPEIISEKIKELIEEYEAVENTIIEHIRWINKESKNESENVMSYIRTRFFRFLVLLQKNTQHAPQKVYSFVPIQDFDKPWTDEKLYKKYGLIKEEIDFIEAMVRPMEPNNE